MEKYNETASTPADITFTLKMLFCGKTKNFSLGETDITGCFLEDRYLPTLLTLDKYDFN